VGSGPFGWGPFGSVGSPDEAPMVGFASFGSLLQPATKVVPHNVQPTTIAKTDFTLCTDRSLSDPATKRNLIVRSAFEGQGGCS
jgi:hypothetical protein